VDSIYPKIIKEEVYNPDQVKGPVNINPQYFKSLGPARISSTPLN